MLNRYGEFEMVENCFVQKKVAQNYVSGKITISKAAEKAGLTIWEMQQYLICNGFKSQYSIEDLKNETQKIQQKLKK